MQDLLVDLDLAIAAAFKAGQIAEHHRENGIEQLEEKCSACPVVTTADIEIDQYLYHTLLDQTPGYGWLSEEEVTKNDIEGKDRVWVVDPIDGTKGFVKEDGMYSVSIALIEHGVPVVGVVYNPMRNQMFYCAKGHGVFFNDQRMYTQSPDVDEAFLISPMRRKDKPYTQQLIMKTGQFDEVGSIAYRLALIAAGQADMTFVDHDISLWDIAAGAVMLEEQGFEMKNINGDYVDFIPAEPITKNGIFVAKDYIIDELEEEIKHIKQIKE